MSKSTIRCSMKPLPNAICLALLVPALPAVATPSYMITDLGTLGGVRSSGTAINDTGQVVGSSLVSGGNQAFIWQQNTGMVDLGTPAGATTSNATAINNSGQVVGQATIGGTRQAVSWTGTTMTNLAPGPVGASGSVANGINNAGQIVGSVPAGATGPTFIQAVLWPNNASTPVPLQNANIDSTANGINNSGSAVGTRNIQAYVVNTNGVPAPTPLPFLPGGTSNQGQAVNDQGQAVGNATTGSPDFTTHAVLWQNAATSPQDLGVLAGTTDSSANAINGNGQVAGSSYLIEGVSRAFLWSNNGGIVDLNGITSNNPQNLTLANADGINAFGQITGSATTAVGDTHAFLATPTGTLNWTTGSGAWNNTANWEMGFAPNQFLDAVIAPSTGTVSVTGPTAATTVNSLSVGGAGGAATLGLNPGAILTVNNGANLLQGGTLTLGGGNVLGNTTSLVVNGGTFDIQSNNNTLAGVRLQAGSIIGTTGTLTSTSNFDLQSGSVSARLGGTVGLVKTTPGTVVLSGANTYSGGTTVTAGTLQGNASSLQGNIANNATVVFDQATAGTYAGSLSGAGTLTKQGAGSLTLTRLNTFGGGTTVAAGTLINQGILNNQATLTNQSSGNFNNAIGGSLTNTGTFTNQGTVSNSGTLDNQGSMFNQGTLTNLAGGNLNNGAGKYLSNSGTFTNQGSISNYNTGRLDNQNTLAILSGGYLTNFGNVNNSGTFNISNASMATFGDFSNTGALNISTADLSNGGKISNLGILTIDNPGQSLVQWSVDKNGNFYHSGAIGSLLNWGTLNNQNTLAILSGGFLINKGNVNNAGTLDNQGTVVNIGTLFNSGQFNLMSNGQIAGEGNLSNQGTFNISGAGAHVINGSVLNQGTFNVHEASVTYTGNFTNNGAYISDPSTSQFNNLSIGPNGYISGGPQDNFVVTGNFANASTQNTQWNTANSNLVFSSATPGQTAQHQMQLASADKGAKASAAVNNFAWGSVTLSNGDSLTLTPGNNGQGSALYARQINLPGGVGELGNISSDYNVYFDPTLPQNSYLLGGKQFGSGGGLLLPWDFVPFTTDTINSPGFTPNEKGFASALNEACSAPRGSLTVRCVELQSLSVPQQKQAVASLTPDQVNSQAGMNVKFSTTRMDAPFSRLAVLRAGGSTPLSLNINGMQIPTTGKLANLFGPDAKGGAAGADNDLFRDSPLGVFIQARFNFGDLTSNAWDRGFSSQSRNVTAGVDYRFTDQFVAGMAFNYTNVSTYYDQSSGRMDSDTYMGALYGSYYFPKDFYVDWVANYGGNNYAFRRQYQYAGFAGQSNSSPVGNQYSFAVSSGKEFNFQEWLFNPYLRLEYLSMHIDAYQERGGDGFALTTGGQTNQSFVSDLGVQVSHALSLPWGVVTPAFRVEWEHQYLNDNRAIQMRFSEASAGLGYFSMQTGNPSRDYVNLGGSFSAALPNGGGAFLRYESRLGQSYVSEHIVEAGVRLTF